MKRINELLTDYFCEIHNIDVSEPYEIEYVDAIDLLTSDRLDLLPKISWLKAHDEGIATDYADEYYRESIKAITGRTFKEGGKEKEKKSLEDFVNAFSDLRNIEKEVNCKS
nr:hypothetical protein [uncultured Butyrivibrio sp.]